MTTKPHNILSLLKLTLNSPREGARAVIDMKLPLSTRWGALLLTIILAVVSGYMAVLIVPPPPPLDENMKFLESMMNPSPIGLVVTQAFIVTAVIAAVYYIGRLFKGSGSFEDTLIVIAWRDFIVLFLQLPYLAALLIAPPLANFVLAGMLALATWLLTYFIAELHGFKSAFKTFLGIVLTALSFSFVLAGILVAIILSNSP